MKEEKEIVKKFSMYLRAGLIEAGPPLSTILGNYGLNTVKFCEDINNFTKDLPDYFLLKIVIIVYDDRTYEYNVIEPSTSFYLRLVSYDKAIFVNSMGGLKKRLIKVISVEDFFLITFLKFGLLDKKYLNMVLGTMRSMSLVFDDIYNEKETEKTL